MNSKIIILSSGFPHEEYETFLMTECGYLKKDFDEIIFCPMDVCVDSSSPNCIQLIEKDGKIIQFLKSLSSIIVWQEILKIVFQRKKVILRTKIAIRSWSKAKNIVEQLLPFSNESSVVFYTYWGMEGAVALAILKKKFPKSHVVARFHGYDVFKSANEIGYLPFRSFIARTIPQLCPISKAGKKEIEKWHPQAKPKVSYLGSENKARSLNPFSDELVVLSLSNFNSVKRMSLFFEVIGGLGLSVRWIHIGGGVQSEEIIKAGLKQLPDNIRFEWKGVLPHQEVLELLEKTPISCLINLSSSEGIPVSMMEVMSFGIPVFATNVGGVSEIVDEHCGLLIDPRVNKLEITNALMKFLKSDLKPFRHNARLKWEEHFNAEENYTAFSNYLKSLLND